MREILKPCRQCGAEMLRQHQAIYCHPCAKARQASKFRELGRKRNQAMRPLRIDGVWCCLDCRKPVEQTVINGKKRRPFVRCEPCGRAHRGALAEAGQKAHAAVSKAIKTGQLPRPDTLQCADCDRPAEVYDHRDYAKPLEVDAVCRSCNVMRGHAALPDAGPYLATTLRRAAPSLAGGI